jgi:hypothetical protein
MNPAELASVLQFIILIPSLYLAYSVKSFTSKDSIIFYKTDPVGRNQFTWNVVKISSIFSMCIFGALLMGNFCIFHGCRFSEIHFTKEIRIIMIAYNLYVVLLLIIVFEALRSMRLKVLGSLEKDVYMLNAASAGTTARYK